MKRCPFCGGTDIILREVFTPDTKVKIGWAVFCDGCSIRTGAYPNSTDAKNAWNVRASK